ncbi:MAG: nucleotidyltransferase domain-containing protein [Candidatus Diapherotrites archaeon]|nr:nucleotidyltransferase domain-containing protein [Candidatus Diapherotrites archaeon]
MIGKLFKSETRVKLLEIFLFNPEKEFHLRELARMIDVSPIYVRKEVANLDAVGLVTYRSQGNLSLFKANKTSPIFEDLKNIFIKTISLGTLLKEKMKDYDTIKYALIYGSFAQGVEKQTSDIDLLVVGNISEDELHKVVMEFEKKTSRELNYILWKEKEFQQKAKQGISLLIDIAEHKVIMINGGENEFRQAIGKR